MQLCDASEDVQTKVKCIGALECLAQFPSAVDANRVSFYYALPSLPPFLSGFHTQSHKKLKLKLELILNTYFFSPLFLITFFLGHLFLHPRKSLDSTFTNTQPPPPSRSHPPIRISHHRHILRRTPTVRHQLPTGWVLASAFCAYVR